MESNMIVSENKKKRVFIVDGYGQIYRSYFAFVTNPLKDRQGNNVSAVFGFFNTIMSIVRQYKPDYLVVAMDSKGKTFRHEMYPQYKANREKTPEDLHAQIPVIQNFLDGMHIPHFARQGMEADDIIATIAKNATEHGLETVMVTGDKDLLQLVKPEVFALRPPRRGEKDYRLCNADDVKELFGVTPSQIVDYLTILGDSSDNVPGINGIGEKGAVKLLSDYHSLENAYANIASLSKGVAAKLEAAKDHIQLSHDLIVLSDNVFDDATLDIESFSVKNIDWAAGISLFKTINSDSLAKAAQKLSDQSRQTTTATSVATASAGPLFDAAFTDANQKPDSTMDADNDETASESAVQSENQDDEPVSVKITLVTETDLEAFLSSLKDNSIIAIKLKVTDEDDMKASILEINLASDTKNLYLVMPTDGVKASLSKHLPRLRLIGQNLKSTIKVLLRWGVTAKDDTSTVNNAKEKTLKPYADTDLAEWLLDTSLTKFEEQDCCTSIRRLPKLEAQLKEKGLLWLFYNMEIPLSEILCDMELQGIELDKDRLKALGVDLEKDILKIQEDIYTLCGKQFNINSPKQLQEVLFVDRKLKGSKKTRSGYSTDSDVLEELAETTDDPVPALILRYRIANKLLSTYVNSLPNLINSETGRVHTSFLQTGTATGRLSSKNPNLQNIPIRTEEGRRIRDAFVPKEGCKLMSADYSQIELVVLAHISGDANLRAAFINGSDVHRETAALTHGISPEMVTAEQRQMAKAINFGIMYGMSAYRLAKEIKVGVKEAKNFIERYFNQYISVAQFIQNIHDQARRDGFVRTALGHIRYIPEMRSSNKVVAAAAERVSVNTIIQGTAAEIMKLAMISIHNEMARQHVKSKLLLQVHDEVIFEVEQEEEKLMYNLVKTCMENAYKLSVPLRVGIEFGSSWGEMH